MTSGEGSVPMPWRAKPWDYGTVGDLRIPRMGQVSWLLPEGEFVYWRREITGAQHQ